jgi:RNA polymerase sigma-70 factor (ECF subfamily)
MIHAPSATPAPPPVDDAELVRRFQSGSRDAFEELMRRHMDSVYNLGARMCPRRADGQDLVQDTFLSAYRHLAGFRGQASFRTWLLRIAANSCLRMKRDRKVPGPEERPLDESVAEGPARTAGEGEGPEGMALRGELRQAIDRAIGALPPGLRLAFVLREQEGLSTREAAEVLGISEGALKTRLSRARDALAQGLRGYVEGGGRG